MQRESSVITQAVDGIGVKLAKLYDLSVGRLYQILEANNYDKTKRLIRFIGLIDKERVRPIKADLDSLFIEIFGEVEPVEISVADLHSELNDVIQARLKGLSNAERLRECWEAVTALNSEIQSLEKAEIQRDNFSGLAPIGQKGVF